MMTTTEVLESHVGICKLLAQRYSGIDPAHDFDDLFQEARIAVYNEALKRPGDPLKKLAGTVVHRRLQKVTTGSRSRYKPKYINSIDEAIERAGDYDSTSALAHIEQALGSGRSAEDDLLSEPDTQSARDLRVIDAINMLPPTPRAVLNLQMTGVTLEQTGVELGIPVATVKALRERNVNTLRYLLKDEYAA